MQKKKVLLRAAVRLHNQMSAHGPDLEAFEKASNADLQTAKTFGNNGVYV